MAFATKGYEIDEFRLARCVCGSDEHRLHADDDEGVAMRVCAECGSEHFICDSAEHWSDAHPEAWSRVECGSDVCNVGVGFALHKDRSAVKWLYVGERCAQCHVLGCFAGWKIGYEPSLQLMDQI